MTHQPTTTTTATPYAWYYSPELGFTHCTTCDAYATRSSRSLHEPLERVVVLQHCERFRAERNQMSSALTQLKAELDFYRNERLRLNAEIASLKKSVLTLAVSSNDHSIGSSDPGSTQTPPTTSNRNARAPRTITQLQSLMTAAHEPGNVRALTKVKALCAEAHATSRELKTPLQQYLLIHWRNPDHDPQGNATSQTHTKTNPRRDDPIEVWYDYLCTHQSSWPRGVRRDANNHPFLPDLKASRAVAQIRPVDTQTASPSANPRFEFMSILITLLDTQGLYEKTLHKNDIIVSSIIDFKPYHLSYPITVDFVARHLADCGITVQMVREELEPWAHEYKLSRDAE